MTPSHDSFVRAAARFSTYRDMSIYLGIPEKQVSRYCKRTGILPEAGPQGTRIWDADRRAKFHELYNQGLRDGDIARGTNCSRTAVFRYRESLNLPPNVDRGGAGRRPARQKGEGFVLFARNNTPAEDANDWRNTARRETRPDFQHEDAAYQEFIRTRGVLRCPPAFVCPSSQIVRSDDLA